MSTANAAFPPLDTPVGYAQFLWRSSRAKVAGGAKQELTGISMKPTGEDEALHFTVILLNGRQLHVIVADELAETLCTSPPGGTTPRKLSSHCMADVVLIFISAMIAVVGAVLAAFMLKTARRRRAIEEKQRSQPQFARRQLEEIDDYIRLVNEATSDDEVDDLESKRREKE